MILFASLVPSDKKNVNILIATIFVFNTNVYFIMPLVSILRNEKIRNFVKLKIASRQTATSIVSENLNVKCFHCGENTIFPA